MTSPSPRSGLMDRPDSYGPVTRVLHWVMAALLAWQWLGMAVKLVLGRQPLAAFFVGTHASVGLMLLALILLRLVWAGLNAGRRPPHGDGWLGKLAKAGQGVLYLLLLVVPALALLRALGGTRPLRAFGTEVFAGRETAVPWMTAPADAVHGFLAWTLLVLVTGHVLMALVHQWLLRDGTLRRMA